MRRKQKDPGFGEGRELLLEGTRYLGLSLSQKQIDSFSSYLSLLLIWNSRFNLTSIKTPTLIIRLHFIDSLAIAPFIRPTGRLLDVGSGAGFPGIPLKIISPKKEVILVEPQRKKANFMREVIRTLKIDGMEVVEDRAEKIDPRMIGLFSEVVTRALGSPDLFLRISFPLLSTGGQSLIMHGPTGAGLFGSKKMKCPNARFSECRLEHYSLPIGGEQRTLLIYVKK